MFDIVVVTDPRFSGGTASAVIADVTAFCAGGARVGLLPVTSAFFTGSIETANNQVLDLVNLECVTDLSHASDISTNVVFFHHPLTFFYGVSERVKITAKTSVVVAHHPPFRGDGSLEYNPVLTNRRIAKSFGVTPLWAPVSGLIRQHLRSFAPLIRLSSHDWVNIFDPAAWQSRRPVFTASSGIEPHATVGRHARTDLLKWPEAPEDMTAPLGHANGEWRTRVMGCPAQAMIKAGADISNWSILDFNQEPVDQFLDSLDVFSYFYNANWVEAFGRTMVEAMLMERPCVLDPRLQQTFGDLALYCKPSEAPALLEALRQAPQRTRARAKEVRSLIAEQYSSKEMPRRLNQLQNDRGTVSRKSGVLTSPLLTLRKTVGLSRRLRD